MIAFLKRYGATIFGVVGNDAARAGSASGTLNVSVRINGTCTISTQPLSFGQFDDLSANRDGQGSVSVTCPAGQTFAIGYGNGNNFSGGTRRMANGTSFVSYSLFQDSARTQSLPASVSNQTATAGGNVFQIYGRIPAAVAPASGAYTDNIAITITY
jgi:spore coat protein U-like protein